MPTDFNTIEVAPHLGVAHVPRFGLGNRSFALRVVVAGISPAVLIRQNPMAVLWSGVDQTARLQEHNNDPRTIIRGLSGSDSRTVISPDLVQPRLAVLEGDDLLASVPARLGVPLPIFGSRIGYVMDVWIDELVITAGYLTRPGEFGAKVRIGVRQASSALGRSTATTSSAGAEPASDDTIGELYGQLS